MKPTKSTAQTKDKQPILVFLLAFLVPVAVMLIIFAAKGIYPFGNNSFLRTDMYHQYAPFYSELLDKLQNGGSLLYTWDVGSGTNFLALFAYYLASPFNWLLLICPKAYLIEFMSYMIIFKIGLCGLAFSWYLSKRSDSRSPAIALISTCYALSAYIAAYSWNIMWLDCIALAPIILLGLERLVKEDKCLLYCISLGLCIISNYYISIMVCIFLVLYFIVQMIVLPSYTVTIHTGLDGSMIKKKVRTKYAKKFFNFFLYSLIAGGLAGVLLIPELKALGLTASGSSFSSATTTPVPGPILSALSFLPFYDKLVTFVSVLPKTFSSYFSVFDMLARHFVNITCEIGLEHWPNIYSGVIVLLLFPLYIMNKNVNFKEKVAGGALLLFMLLSFSWNIPNFIWHGFHYPNSLPCRQSFLYTAVLLAMCWDGLKDLRRFSVRQIMTSFWIVAIFILLAEKLIDVEDFKFYNYYVTFAIVGLFTLLAYLYKTGKLIKSTSLILAFTLLSLELGMNMAITSVTLTSRSAYLANYDDYQTLIAQAETQTPTFFRMEKDNSTRKSKDDGAYMNYRSTSVFSSMANKNLTAFYKQFGFESSTNAYGSLGATPVTSALLGVKYIFSKVDNLDEGSVFVEAGVSNNLIMYENPYALNLGFMIPATRYQTLLGGVSGNPIDVQNQFLRITTGISDVFTSFYGSTSGGNYNSTVKQDGYIYAYVTNTSISKITAYIGEDTKTFSDVKRGYVLDLGYCEAGTTIQLTNDDGANVNATCYRLDEISYAKAMKKLQENQLIVDAYGDTYVTGHVDAKEAGTMIVTIPFEENGWTIKVDGKEIEPEHYKNAFYAIPLEEGAHSIEFTYVPDGYKLGAKISLGSFAALLLIILITYLVNKKKNTKKEAAPKKKKNPLVIEAPSLEDSPSVGEGEIDHVITIDDLPRGDETPVAPEETTES